MAPTALVLGGIRDVTSAIALESHGLCHLHPDLTLGRELVNLEEEPCLHFTNG
jgi:hypothetical protein